MEIIKPSFPTMEEQVQANKLNIEALANTIKPLFNATVELTEQTTTIDTSNVRDWVEGTSDGFLIDNSGYLFKIVAVTDNTIYLQFWTDLEGPQGVQGEQGPPGETGPQGEPGPRGTQISAAASLPPTEGAILGDLFIDTGNGTMYRFGDTAWYEIYKFPESGIEEIRTMNLVSGDPTSVTFNSEDGVIVESQGQIQAEGPNLGLIRTYIVNVSNKIPIVGSETIVLDSTEDGKHVEAHLAAETVSKIDRSLVTPITPPPDIRFVAISANGEQEAVGLGEGITYDSTTKTLNASGGSTTKKYLHRVHASSSTGSYEIYISIVSTNRYQISSIDTLRATLNNVNSKTAATAILASGYAHPSTSAHANITGIWYSDYGISLRIIQPLITTASITVGETEYSVVNNVSYEVKTTTVTPSTITSVNDTVTEL